MQSQSEIRNEPTGIAYYLGAIKSAPAALKLAVLIAFLPIANGLLLKTYHFPLRPGILNPLFELEILYVAAEIGIILWAREKGMSYRAQFGQLAKITRFALVAFLLTFWISSLIFAPAPIYSMIRALYWPLHIVCAFAVSYLLNAADSAFVRKSMRGFALLFLLLTLLVYVHFLGVPVSLFEPTKGFQWSAYAPGFLSIRQFGMVAGFSLACWLAYDLSGERPATKGWLVLAASALMFAALFWSGTRSALLGVGVAVPLTVAFARKRPAVLALGSLCVAIAIGGILSEIWLPPEASFGIFNPDRFAMGGDNDIMSGRAAAWKFGAEMFTQSPILGWGEGSFYQLYAMARHDYHLQPHNFVIQFLMSWGIFAGGIALVMMARALWRLHWNLYRARAAMAPLAALDCILVIAMFDGAMFTLRTIVPAIFFWILAEKISAAARTNPTV